MIPCYILDSSKPIWRGELQTCEVLLGANSLLEQGSPCEKPIMRNQTVVADPSQLQDMP